jgi:hypothetical protein
VLWQGIQKITLCLPGTLRQGGLTFKQKAWRLCAEAVDAQISLWKRLEKPSEIRCASW